MGRLDGLMLWQLMNINDKIPTAEEVAKAIVDEEVKRREDEKAYWEAWDKAFKEGTIERLRNEKDIHLMTLDQKPIYSQFTQDDIADMLESGELQLICLNKLQARCAIWTDESRKEAQDEKYLMYLQRVRQALEDDPEHRII